MIRLSVCAAIVVASAGQAVAQDWAFISTAGDPDPVTGFDLSDPTGSQVTLGFVDGNFNRALDFDTQNSFYYFVSTDALNDPGDRGLWRWNNGVNTQVATIGFSDSGDGDGTLSADGRTFYVSVQDDDGTSGDSIYEFTDLGGTVMFNEVGETGLSQLIGLAVNPLTGLMYGYDSSTEALYQISTEDGSATLIGASGISIGAIGGMDFDNEGNLLLAQGGDLWSVNLTDGSLTSAGSIGLNASALSFRAPAPGAVALLGMAGAFSARRRR